jgi:hypothetical protein
MWRHVIEPMNNRNPAKTRGDPRFHERISSSCSTSGTRRDIHVNEKRTIFCYYKHNILVIIWRRHSVTASHDNDWKTANTDDFSFITKNTWFCVFLVSSQESWYTSSEISYQLRDIYSKVGDAKMLLDINGNFIIWKIKIIVTLRS